MDKDQINTIAEKIAQAISSESKTTDLESLQKSLDDIGVRLDKLESQSSIPHSAIRTPHSTHPSQERFNIAEAIADGIFSRDPKEKACTFEPNDRPCDHCSMCSSLGF